MSHRFWLLVADASRATIYGGRGPIAELELVREFENPEGRAQERELVTDRPGRRSDEGSAHSSAMETNVKDNKEKSFATKITVFLDTAFSLQEFEHLSIVAPPSMLGHLRAKLSSPIKQAVLEEVAKALAHKPVEEVREHLTRLHPS